jgi:hypothetical protein
MMLALRCECCDLATACATPSWLCWPRERCRGQLSATLTLLAMRAWQARWFIHPTNTMQAVPILNSIAVNCLANVKRCCTPLCPQLRQMQHATDAMLLLLLLLEALVHRSIRHAQSPSRAGEL